jgi:hypothetical protein
MIKPQPTQWITGGRRGTGAGVAAGLPTTIDVAALA